MEIVVTLHFPNGTTCVTCYPRTMLAQAISAFSAYVAEGKRATITNV